MLETIENQLAILTNEQLSPDELFIIRLILLAQEEDNMSYLGQYLQLPEAIRGDFRQKLLNLQERSIILKSYRIPNKGEKFDVFAVEFNKNFVKRIHKESFTLGKELYRAYPDFAQINGIITPIKTVSKKYNSLEDAFIAYGRAINNKIEIHKEVIDLVTWGAENGIINCSLASFIIDHRWEALKKLKEGQGNANVNFDNVKLL